MAYRSVNVRRWRGGEPSQIPTIGSHRVGCQEGPEAEVRPIVGRGLGHRLEVVVEADEADRVPGEGRDATQCLSWEFLPMAANSVGTIASWPSGTSAAKHASRQATGGLGDFARETFAWADQRLANQPSAGVSDHPPPSD